VRRFLLLLLVGVLNPSQAHAQRDTSPYLTTGVIAGAAMGGIGAILNREPGESWPRTFVRGAATGAAGGWLQYQAKRQVTKVTTRDRLEYAWLARTLHAAGSSVIENAAANRGALESFRFNVGFVRLDLDTRTGSVQPRLLPASLVATLYLAKWGHFDSRTSLRTGVLTFRAFEGGGRVRGHAVTRVNAVMYSGDVADGAYFNEVMAHELTHTLQYDDFAGVPLFAKPLTKQRQDWWLARNVGRWIYPDLQSGIDAFRYAVLNSGTSHCTNALELEAHMFSARGPYRC
jgi:hypothetical protein